MSVSNDETLLTNALRSRLATDGPLRRLRELIEARRFPVTFHGPKSAFVGYTIVEVSSYRPLLVITPNEVEAVALASDVTLFGGRCVHLQAFGTAPYSAPPPTAAIWGRRSQALVELATVGATPVVVASWSAVARGVVATQPPLVFERGQTVDTARLAAGLIAGGYWRVPRVEVPGEFALRGEVCDIFPAGAEQALRLVFDFDELTDLRWFDVGSQASTARVVAVRLAPMNEFTWGDERRPELTEAFTAWPELTRHATELETVLGGDPDPDWNAALTRPGLTPAIASDRLVVWVDRERIVTIAERLIAEYEAAFAAQQFARPTPHPERVLVDPQALQTESAARSIVIESLADATRETDIAIACDPPRSFFGNVSFLKEELGALERSGNQVVVLADTEAQRKRIEHLLQDFSATVATGRVSGGFALPRQRFVLIQENEIFGRRKRAPAGLARVKSAPIDTFIELNEGDYIVHANYGIGIYRGIARMQAAGNERDYIKLEYAGQENVFTPIEQVNLIQRYIGSGGAPPRVDTLGGKSWEKRKARVRKNVEDLADHLIGLYARRKRSRGYAFPVDTEWQLAFEASFPYQETEDQLRCIDEIKRDMERSQPMDRLVCGDVGYGKTELALRATFKAVVSGKQAAMLAPTTILVEQHYETMRERFDQFPVRLAMLSRFVSPRDQRRVIEGLAAGEIDAVVGTHRLLQHDVVFRDLGLLVVDEEQRFGVKAKERLKELRANVDTLTLTATPIPRTLHMSLLKIRDLSVLRTPPRNRRAIETVIAEYDETRVATAIRREVERGGQVFFLHNRVETLERVEQSIRSLVPEVIVASAHGRMSATELEEIMHRFIHGAFHVLVATTIIENGIDIPNVNTIVIDRADLYGVSQLYQLRGRVGRSERAAYAYLLYPERRALTELAMKRLQIISDHTELGGGFKIALKDLEVRGAGNLLGREQSGDILSVGFDMYLQLLDDAIKSAEDLNPRQETYMELEYTGFIPDSYVADTMEKMEVYKKIAAVRTAGDVEALLAEIEDRFGPLPDEVQSLLSLAEIRVLAERLGIATVKERKGVVRLEFAEVAKISVERVLSLIKNSGGAVRPDPERPNALLVQTGAIGLKEKSEFIRDRVAQLL